MIMTLDGLDQVRPLGQSPSSRSDKEARTRKSGQNIQQILVHMAG
jgi:hypothetical protein